MKRFAFPNNQDGFQASIEFLRFLDATTDDLIESITALVGTNTVFIKGGAITQSGGNTTISDGIIVKDNKLYTFVGGTYAGTPATLKVLFSEATAAGFPQPYFVGDPIPKDVYLAKTSKVDATGTVFLNTIGNIYNLQIAKPILDNAAIKNHYIVNNTTSFAAGFSAVSGYGLEVREYDDGTVSVRTRCIYSGTKNIGTMIITGLPNADLFNKIVPVYMIDGSATTRTVGYISVAGNTAAVFSGFSTSVNQAYIDFEYKKR